MDACFDSRQKPAVRKHRATRKLQLLTAKHLDGRTRTRKAFDAIVRGISQDLQEDQLSVIQQNLIQAFAGAAVHVHDLNAKLMKGEKVDVLQHSQAISSMVRVASRLPIGRIPPDTETLDQYLKRTHQPTQNNTIIDAEANT